MITLAALMRIKILTQYYPPETGAPQNRLHALAKACKEAGHDVEVLTAMPHYPAMKIQDGYRWRMSKRELVDGVNVLRAWIFASSSKSLIPRLLNYFSFVFSSLIVGTFRLGKGDVLILESPPLFLAYSAFWLCRIKGMKLVTNVSDLWPESAIVLGLVKNKSLIRMTTSLENRMYKKSHLISGQTKGIVAHIQERFPNKKLVWFPNGADLEAFNPDEKSTVWREKFGLKSSDLIFSYSGILGHAQGLDVIIEAAKILRDRTEVHFVLVGAGPVKERLSQKVEELGLANIHFCDVVPRDEIRKLLAESVATIVPLKKSPLFEGAIPSKIFESLAMQVPVLLGVDGESRRLFVDEGKCAVYFAPENEEALATCIQQVVENESFRSELGEKARQYVSLNFDRTKVNMKFINALEEN